MILVAILFVLVLATVGCIGASRLGSWAAAVAALFTLAVIGMATAFVFGDDGYVADGTSKWANRGSEAHDLYIAAVAVAGVLATLYVVLAARRTRGPAVAAAIVIGGLLEAFGLIVLLLAFGSN